MRNSSKTQSISDVIELSKEYEISNIFFRNTTKQEYYELCFKDSHEKFFSIKVFKDFDKKANTAYALIHDLDVHYVQTLDFDKVQMIFNGFNIKYRIVTKCNGDIYHKCHSITYSDETKYYLECLFHIYALSDTHFWHSTRLQNSPYTSIEEYNENLILKINMIVPKYAILILAGDVYIPSDSRMGKQDQIRELKNIREQINCERVGIVRGNHDVLTWMDYLECGFYDIRDSWILNNYKIIITHEKIKYDIGEYRNVFGHVHDQEITDRTFNCSVNALNGFPKSILEISKLMNLKLGGI